MSDIGVLINIFCQLITLEWRAQEELKEFSNSVSLLYLNVCMDYHFIQFLGFFFNLPEMIQTSHYFTAIIIYP